MTDLLTRPAVELDIKSMLAIEKSFAPDPWSREDFKICLKQNNIRARVAIINNRVIGYLVYELHKSSKQYYLSNLVVHPNHRRIGIGWTLLEEALQDLSQKYRSILTIQMEDNLDALLFLRACGFIARKVVDYRPNKSAIEMVFRYGWPRELNK